MSTRISVTRAAELARVNVSYIRAEIARWNEGEVQGLPATKNVTGGWEIKMADFKAWMANPRRGSRSKIQGRP